MARGVPVEIDGEEHRLFYSMRSVKRIEERFDISFLDGEAIETVSFDDALWLVMLGLEHEQPKPPTWWDQLLGLLRIRPVEEPLTVDRLAEVLDVRGMEEVVNAVGRALSRGDQEASTKKKEGS